MYRFAIVISSKDEERQDGLEDEQRARGARSGGDFEVTLHHFRWRPARNKGKRLGTDAETLDLGIRSLGENLDGSEVLVLQACPVCQRLGMPSLAVRDGQMANLRLEGDCL
jgi:hypothetical protein